MRLQHFKDSWKKSQKPFESISGKLTFIISLVACLVLAHAITESWGNYMTWLALGIPAVVWLIYFVWNLANFHHKFHKDRTPALITILLFLVVALTVLFVAEFSEIKKLKNQPQENHKSEQQSSIAPKPLPDKIIPAPAPPPIVSTPQVASVEPPKQFETNFPDTNDVSDPDSEIQRLKAVRVAQQEAQKQAEIQRKNSIATNSWDGSLPIFSYALQKLYDILLAKAATIPPDGIVIPYGYLKCLPTTLGYEVGDTNVANIRLQTKTNLDFQISITSIDGMFQKRTFKISCSCGLFEIRPTLFSNQYFWHINVPDEDKSDPIDVNEGFQEIINTNLMTLVNSQIYYLSHTNK